MPHIYALFPNTVATQGLFAEYPNIVRQTLADLHGYSMDEIALILQAISGEAQRLSENLLPLEFVIDPGWSFKPERDDYAEVFRDELIRRCPPLDNIHFGVYFRDKPNGYSEHIPDALERKRRAEKRYREDPQYRRMVLGGLQSDEFRLSLSEGPIRS